MPAEMTCRDGYCRFLWRRSVCGFFAVFSGSGDSSEHPVRSRNQIYISNGVVGCGFGVLFVALVLPWLPKTIRGLWFVDIVLRIFNVCPSLQVLRAETLVERFTARMHVRWCLWLARGVWEMACRDGSVSSNTVLQPGRRSGQNDEQKIREKFYVLLDCSGS